MKSLYETDFSAWLDEQIQALKKKDFSHLDVTHLLEEIEDLGNSERKAVQSHLINLMVHLIKQNIQSNISGKSWDDSIAAARAQLKLYTEDSKILKKHMNDVFADSYKRARNAAAKEMKMESGDIPMQCPWSLNFVLGE